MSFYEVVSSNISETLNNLDINNNINSACKTAQKVTSNPTTIKKIGQLVTKVIAAVDYYKDREHLKEFVRNLKGMVEVIDLLGTVKNIVFWADLFNFDKIDTRTFIDSLAKTVVSNEGDFSEAYRLSEAQELVKTVREKCKNAKNIDDIKEALKQTLEENEYEDADIERILGQVEITIKPRTNIENLYMICYTVADLGYNTLTLHHWSLVDLGKYAGKIGTVKIFSFAAEVTIESAAKAFLLVGMTASLIDAITKYRNSQTDIIAARNEQEQDEAALAASCAKWDLATSSIDFSVAMIPLMLRLSVSLIPAVAPFVIVWSTPALIGLAVVAKGLGVASIFFKP